MSGYGFAKSTTDILITKGINRYFLADSGAAADLKQDNIKMSLILSARNGSVRVEGLQGMHTCVLESHRPSHLLLGR